MIKNSVDLPAKPKRNRKTHSAALSKLDREHQTQRPGESIAAKEKKEKDKKLRTAHNIRFNLKCADYHCPTTIEASQLTESERRFVIQRHHAAETQALGDMAAAENTGAADGSENILSVAEHVEPATPSVLSPRNGSTNGSTKTKKFKKPKKPKMLQRSSSNDYATIMKSTSKDFERGKAKNNSIRDSLMMTLLMGTQWGGQ